MRFNLRKKLILTFIAIAAIPLVIALSLVAYQTQNIYRGQIIENKLHFANDGTEEISFFFTLQFKALDNVDLISHEIFPDPFLRGLLLDRILLTNQSIVDIAIVDEHGNEIDRKHRFQIVREGDLRSRAETEEFQTIQHQKYYISSLFFERNIPYIIVGKQIVTPRRQFNGAIFALVDARTMTQAVQNISSPEEQRRSYVVDENGIVVGHQDISQVLGKRDFSHLAIAQRIQKNPEEHTFLVESYLNEHGEEVLGVAERITLKLNDEEDFLQTPWFVVVEQNASFAFAPLSQLTTNLLLLIIVTLFVSVSLAWILGSGLVRPIEALHRAAQQFEQRKFSHRVSIKSGDEIEDLANQFNAMTKTIRTHIADLAGERNKLAIILSGITDGVIAVDRNRNIIVFNKVAEKLLGIPRQNAIGKPIDIILNLEKDGKKISAEKYCPIKNDGYEGTVFSVSNANMRNSQEKNRLINMVAGTIREGKAVNLGCILTIHDVTEERMLDRLKAEFVAIAAHQMRTPLSAIKWALLSLEEDLEGRLQNNEKRMIKNIYQSNERMIHLINDLLNASQLEGKQQKPISRETLHLEHVLRSAVEERQKEAKEQGTQFLVRTPKVIPPIQGDAKLLKIVIQNLLDNAIAYTPAGSRVSVLLTIEDDVLKVMIKDAGIGIPEEDQEKIFTKFFRGTNARRVKPDGSGLGLFIVRNAIEAHGGKVWFESKVGRGTTFIFTIPISQDSASKKGAS